MFFLDKQLSEPRRYKWWSYADLGLASRAESDSDNVIEKLVGTLHASWHHSNHAGQLSCSPCRTLTVLVSGLSWAAYGELNKAEALQNLMRSACRQISSDLQ